jgi:hypothetical protein
VSFAESGTLAENYTRTNFQPAVQIMCVVQQR